MRKKPVFLLFLLCASKSRMQINFVYAVVFPYGNEAFLHCTICIFKYGTYLIYK